MLKDYIMEDINKIFINTGEHGETVEINNVDVDLVQDKDHLDYRKSKDAKGLLSGDVLFYISETEYSKIPKMKHPPRTGDALMFAAKPATITDVISNAGLYEIIIEFAGARNGY